MILDNGFPFWATLYMFILVIKRKKCDNF